MIALAARGCTKASSGGDVVPAGSARQGARREAAKASKEYQADEVENVGEDRGGRADTAGDENLCPYGHAVHVVEEEISGASPKDAKREERQEDLEGALAEE